jgi:hypothetical protein
MAIHLTRPLQFPQTQRGHEPAALCGLVMASVRHSRMLKRLGVEAMRIES